MKYQIRQNKLTDQIKKKIFDGFSLNAIDSTGVDGFNEDSISFEIFDDEQFVGAIVVQSFWGQLHIKYLYVEKNYRGRGFARQLMNHALDDAKNRGCHFAFVETMSFQAPKFYKKMGFTIEFSRPGYLANTDFHYLKKNLNDLHSVQIRNQITRIGVYGVAIQEGKILTVLQQRGPFKGKMDFPGGGIEFGESPEQALRRELLEEVRMVFDAFHFIDNLTTTVDVPENPPKSQYTFYQIGMIYQLEGFQFIKNQSMEELQFSWVNLKNITEDQCSSLLWKYLQTKKP